RAALVKRVRRHVQLADEFAACAMTAHSMKFVIGSIRGVSAGELIAIGAQSLRLRRDILVVANVAVAHFKSSSAANAAAARAWISLTALSMPSLYAEIGPPYSCCNFLKYVPRCRLDINNFM